MNNTHLSTNELDRITSMILDDYGSDLTTDDLREVIFTYFDNISGLETTSEQDLKWYFEVIINSYLRSIAGIEK